MSLIHNAAFICLTIKKLSPSFTFWDLTKAVAMIFFGNSFYKSFFYFYSTSLSSSASHSCSQSDSIWNKIVLSKMVFGKMFCFFFRGNYLVQTNRLDQKIWARPFGTYKSRYCVNDNMLFCVSSLFPVFRFLIDFHQFTIFIHTHPQTQLYCMVVHIYI